MIVEVVRHAATFCDKIVHLDNCSTDGTWELVGELEAEDPDRFVRLRQFDEPFYDGIRAEVYNAYRDELGDGWWMMLDSDEMMDHDPRPLLAEAAAAGDDAVHCWLAQFVFTTAIVGRGKPDGSIRPLPSPVESGPTASTGGSPASSGTTPRWSGSSATTASLGPIRRGRSIGAIRCSVTTSSDHPTRSSTDWTCGVGASAT